MRKKNNFMQFLKEDGLIEDIKFLGSLLAIMGIGFAIAVPPVALWFYEVQVLPGFINLDSAWNIVIFVLDIIISSLYVFVAASVPPYVFKILDERKRSR